MRILVVNNGDQHQDDHKKHQGENWGQRGQSSPLGLLKKFSLGKFHVHTDRLELGFERFKA